MSITLRPPRALRAHEIPVPALLNSLEAKSQEIRLLWSLLTPEQSAHARQELRVLSILASHGLAYRPPAR